MNSFTGIFQGFYLDFMNTVLALPPFPHAPPPLCINSSSPHQTLKSPLNVLNTCGFFAGTLIWYHTHTNTHTHEDTQHTQGPVNWHAHINIYLYHLLCSHSSYLYYTEWITHWYQKCTFHNVFSFQKLCACKVIYLLIRCYESRFFLWNTNNTDRNGVNKQKTHTPNTQRKITLERVS